MLAWAVGCSMRISTVRRISSLQRVRDLGASPSSTHFDRRRRLLLPQGPSTPRVWQDRRQGFRSHARMSLLRRAQVSWVPRRRGPLRPRRPQVGRREEHSSASARQRGRPSSASRGSSLSSPSPRGRSRPTSRHPGSRPFPSPLRKPLLGHRGGSLGRLERRREAATVPLLRYRRSKGKVLRHFNQRPLQLKSCKPIRTLRFMG
jgi:hypothetical protein